MYDLRLSYRCNNNCRFCEVAPKRKTYQDLTLEEAKDKVMKAKILGEKTIEFYGGEPTISPHFLDVIKFITEQGMNFKLNSNLRMFSYRNFTEKVVEENIIAVNTSIESHKAKVHDYLTRVPGSFEQTVKGIKNLLEYQDIDLMTTTIMLKHNTKNLRDVAEFLFDLGIDKMRFSFLQIRGNILNESYELTPKFSEMKPYLLNLIDYVENQEIKLVIDQGPICVIPEYSKFYESILNIQALVRGVRKKDELFVKSPQCASCIFNEHCTGASLEYEKLFGLGELKPIMKDEDSCTNK